MALMKKTTLALVWILLASLACTPTKQATELPEHPNILWLVAEDLSPIIPPFGDSTVVTPNLNRLAREGVRFTNVYSVSGVCAPSRFSIATGVYTTSAGAHNMRTSSRQEYMAQIGLIPYETVPPPEVKMMSEILRRNGYYCTNNSKTDYQFRAPVTAWDESSNKAHWRNRPKGKPFFLIFNFGVTHESRVWAKAKDSLLINPELEVPIPPYLPETEAVKTDVRRVYSNIIEMDRQVGAILQQLENDGLLDSTIIVWYSDHGGPLPRQKRLLYDSGLHVPMIIRFPNQHRAGEVDDQLISFIDFAPTTFSLVGIDPPAWVQGRAFLGKYKAQSERQYIHAAADRLDTEYDMIRAVRDKRFKYLRNFYPDRPYYLKVVYREQMATMQELLRLNHEGKLNEYQAQWFRQSKPEEELFDCQNDPHELHNLADDPAYADKLAELRAECDRWMKEVDDKGFIPEKDLIEKFWPDWKQPTTAQPEYKIGEGRITLTCETEGASIAYQITDVGAEPSKHWRVYVKPVELETDKTLHTLAHRIGYKPSEVVEVKR